MPDIRNAQVFILDFIAAEIYIERENIEIIEIRFGVFVPTVQNRKKMLIDEFKKIRLLFPCSFRKPPF